MATLKELTTKIASLKSTQKMTKTMKLVAASRMRRAQQAQERAHEYAVRQQRLLDNVSASVAGVSHPLLEKRDPVRSVLLLVVVSDRGLCGGFNNSLLHHVEDWHAENLEKYERIEMSFCGRRGYTHLKHSVPVRTYYEGATEHPSYAIAEEMALEIMSLFTEGEFDEIHVAYNRFKNTLVQIPTLTRLLPIQPSEDGEKVTEETDYIFEPAGQELLQLLLPTAVKFRTFNVLLENAAGEHAARMTAMESASRNAGDLIDRYTLLRNRERQAAITSELIDIVTGAQSL